MSEKTNLSLVGPVNGTSLGESFICLLYELFEKKLKPNIFLIGSADLTAFNGILPQEFIPWLSECVQKASKEFSVNHPALRWWHIDGSWDSVSKHRFLYTFHETDAITDMEANVLKSHEKVFVPCEYNKTVFNNFLVNNVVKTSIGLNKHAFSKNPIRAYDNEICIGVCGKFEKRKRTEKVIKTICDKFGNDRRFKIHLHVYNNFFGGGNPENCDKENAFYVQKAIGRDLFNVASYRFFPSLIEVNKSINAIDIMVDGSGGESFSLPSFTAACLGKTVVAHNCSGIKEWANEKNAILVEPSSKIVAEDGRFFGGKDSNKNVGNFFDFEEEDLSKALDRAVQEYENFPSEEESQKLIEQFSYKNTLENLLSEMKVD